MGIGTPETVKCWKEQLVRLFQRCLLFKGKNYTQNFLSELWTTLGLSCIEVHFLEKGVLVPCGSVRTTTKQEHCLHFHHHRTVVIPQRFHWKCSRHGIPCGETWCAWTWCQPCIQCVFQFSPMFRSDQVYHAPGKIVRIISCCFHNFLRLVTFCLNVDECDHKGLSSPITALTVPFFSSLKLTCEALWWWWDQRTKCFCIDGWRIVFCTEWTWVDLLQAGYCETFANCCCERNYHKWSFVC